MTAESVQRNGLEGWKYSLCSHGIAIQWNQVSANFPVPQFSSLENQWYFPESIWRHQMKWNGYDSDTVINSVI